MIEDQEVDHDGKVYLWSYEAAVPSSSDCWDWADSLTYSIPPSAIADRLNDLFVKHKAPAMIGTLDACEYQRFAGILQTMGVTAQQIHAMKDQGVRAGAIDVLAGFVGVHSLISSRGSGRYSVYVVRLDPAVRNDNLVRYINPNADWKKPCVYVGKTGLKVEERFAKHKNGEKASRYVRDHGVALLPELYSGLLGMTDKDALLVEGVLACELRRQGYTVTGGH